MSLNSSQKAVYLPGLNGIRGIAAMVVLIAHVNDNFTTEFSHTFLPVNLGRFSVTVFFALSGFLITYLLILEREKTSSVSIPKFYLRRVLRIWPLYFGYLLITLIAAFYYKIEINYSALILVFLFAANVSNVLDISTPFTTHYWSLGVEEQFYLFWPWLIRSGRNIGKTIAFFLVVFLIVKLGFRYGIGGLSKPYIFLHMSRFDCMAIGGIAGWMAYYGLNDTFKRLLFHPFSQLLSMIGMVLISSEIIPVFSIIEHSLLAVFTSVLILNVALNPKPIVTLEGKIWDFLGDISFGLYVWHPLILFIAGKYLFELNTNIYILEIIYFVIVAAGSILTAYFSLKYLERPFLRLKDKFSMVNTRRKK